jgi:hypothetical protein
MKTILFACLCVSVIPAIRAQNSGALKESEALLNSLEDSYIQAAIKNDIGFFETHIAPNYMGTGANGESADRAKLLSERRAGHIKYNKFEVIAREIRVSGDVGVVSERIKLDGTKEGIVRKGTYQVTRIWKLDGSNSTVVAYLGVLVVDRD